MRLKWLCMILLAFFFTCGERPAEAAEKALGGKGVREPILAGTWYPGNPEDLKRTIRAYLSAVKGAEARGELRGLVVPHAGYMYSGPVAAHAYRLLEGMEWERVIMIGPSHRVGFKGVSVDLSSGYKTPLGTVAVDQEFGRRLMEADALVQWVPQAHGQEHSLEIQVPFLQAVLKDFRLVPILMGQQDPDTCARLAEILSRALKGHHKTLVLASTDLSHFHSDARARVLDREFIRHVESFDPEGLAQAIGKGSCEACGGGPTVTAMLLAKAMGANRSAVLRYATSGDVTGDRGQVVGYVAAALFKGK